MKIIKVTAMWCSACILTNPKFDEVIKEYLNYSVLEYDYDMDEDIVKEYNVGKIIPVFILLNDNNEEVDRLIGEKNKQEIKTFIERNKV